MSSHKLIILLFIFFLPLGLLSQPVFTWEASYTSPGNENDSYRKMQIDNSGNIYAVGIHDNFDPDILISKYNNTGSLIWTRIFNDSLNRDDRGYDIALDGSGNVYVVGTADLSSPTFNDVVLLKYDSAGTLLWKRFYNSNATYNDLPRKILIDSSDNIYILNQGQNVFLRASFEIIKYSSDGELIWNRKFFNGISSRDYYPVIMTLDNSGNIAAVGSGLRDSVGIQYYFIFTVKYDSSGTLLWNKTISELNGHCNPADIITDNSGNIYITGSGVPNVSSQMLTLKYSPSGVEEWKKYYPSSSGEGYKIFIDNSGNSISVGRSFTGNLIINYDQTGNQVWAAGDSIFPFQSTSAVLTPGGGIIIGGKTIQGGNPYTFLAKFSSEGSRLWHLFDNPTPLFSIDLFDLKYHIADVVYCGMRGTSSQGNNAIIRSFNKLVNITNNNSSIPDRYSLHQNYPNPFNPSTKINFDIPNSGFASLKVYNSLGREVTQLVNSELKAGSYSLEFDGMELSSGVYFYRLQTGGFTDTKKMLLIK